MGICATLIGCDKVPLRADGQHIRSVSAHWFEVEKTTYVFYEADPPKSSGGNSFFEIMTASDGSQTVQSATAPQADSLIDRKFRKISTTWSTHQHTSQNCGDHVCGSFSFKSTTPPSEVTLRLRYHPDSPLGEEMQTGIQQHPDDGTAQAYSVLVYGVFNQTNDQMQIRTESNFGYPGTGEIAKFGMTRKFRVLGEASVPLTTSDLSDLATNSGSAFLYPASLCEKWMPNSASPQAARVMTRVTPFTGEKSWSLNRQTGDDGNPAACMKVEALDQFGNPVVSNFAIARKNPVLTKSSLKLATPLKSAVKIPIVVGFCPDTPEASAMSAPEYLVYQKHVLGITQPDFDACFTIGDESGFSSRLKTALLTKLNAAKSTQTGAGQDLFFTVVLNHRLGTEFDYFQQIVQQRLEEVLQGERGKVSPKLVGALVYDSDETFAPKVQSDSALLWCPRARRKAGVKDSSSSTFSDHGVNCITDQSGGINYTLLSAVAPLGPFPNLASFEDYIQHWGTRGLLKDVEFNVRSVPTGPNTLQLSREQVTFFDGVRLTTPPGSGVRICGEKDEDTALLDHLRFLSSASSNPSTGAVAVSAEDADSALRSGGQTFRVGIKWEFPFVAQVTYKEKLYGKIFGFVPFSASGTTNKIFGDRKWRKAEWDLGPLFQHCERYCDHPFFDDAGTYQINSQWRTDQPLSCVDAKIPTAP